MASSSPQHVEQMLLKLKSIIPNFSFLQDYLSDMSISNYVTTCKPEGMENKQF